MEKIYMVAQGPGKALKFIAELNELIDGDNVATEDSPEKGSTNKGQMATSEAKRLMEGMKKEEALALLGSAKSLHYITGMLESMLQWDIGVRRGRELIEEG